MFVCLVVCLFVCVCCLFIVCLCCDCLLLFVLLLFFIYYLFFFKKKTILSHFLVTQSPLQADSGRFLASQLISWLVEQGLSKSETSASHVFTQLLKFDMVKAADPLPEGVAKDTLDVSFLVLGVCCAVLCCAVLCCAVLCCAMLCYAVLCVCVCVCVCVCWMMIMGVCVCVFVWMIVSVR